ncbi:CHAT domain-containing protein [Actinoallomurus bryophytorum]|uniref:CHAT domain-containing protein n=1 Tax=Actinoallomurus bryophytorum TaxID=1490222 RepID=A0A543C0Q2_9ACTN|nr:CHAT domain-containing protein [Actinoallomurus bryophytorum]TQL90661.1 CHAT domain-containing protein [Actinoallomurus bryophytorum]
MKRRLRLWRALRRARAAQKQAVPSSSARLITRALTANPGMDDRLVLLTGLAAVYEASGDLPLAIDTLATAADLALPDHRYAAPLLLNLSLAYDQAYAVTADRAFLDDAVSAARRARRAVGETHPARADVLNGVVAVLVEAEEVLDRPELLDEAVRAGTEVVAAGDGGRHNLAVAYRSRYERHGHLPDLHAALRHAEDALDRAGAEAETAAELGHILRLLYSVTGAEEDAARAVAACRAAVESTEPDDEEGVARRAILAGALLDAYQAGDQAALEEAVAYARAALTADRDERAFVAAQIAATVLTVWARRHRDIEVAHEAEAAATAAVRATVPDTADRAVALDTLATALYGRFQLTGDPQPLDEAIETGRNAQAIPTSATDHAGHLGNLGTSLFDRYTVTGDRSDLESAVELDRQAGALLDEAHPERGMYLNNLNVALRHRYEVTGAHADLEESIAIGRLATRDAPTPDRPLRLSNLGGSLFVRYERFGDLADLDEDVACQREAAELLPDGYPDAPSVLGNLGLALQSRYRRLGTEADLSEAAEALGDAVAADALPRDRTAIRSLYGQVLHSRWEAGGEEADLRGAIEQARLAVEATHADDPALPQRLGNLVTMLESAAGDSPAAAEEAVAAARRALAVLPDGHPDAPGLRSGLALALSARGDTGDAVREARAAVEETPPRHPDRAQFLINLAYVLRERRAETDDVIAALRQAALLDTAPPAVRLRAAQAWGGLAAERGSHADAARGLSLAVELLPEVSPRRLGRTDAQRWLAGFPGLGCAAAAACLASDEPERAVRSLELGRAVLLNRTLHTRGDTSPLRAVDGALADEFERLRDRLDALPEEEATPFSVGPASGAHGGDAHARMAAARRRERRSQLVERFADVVRRIERLPGFGGFLRPPAVDELLAEARTGPVVMVNVGDDRGDALLLTAAGLRHVPLSGLRAERLNEIAFEFHRDVAQAHDRSVGRAAREEAEGRLADVLDWLWTTIAAPVLAELDQAGYARSGRTIWWVPTGMLAFLPLHAATRRDGGDSLLEHAVSRYTPTVTSLHLARRTMAAGAEPRAGVIVSMGEDHADRSWAAAGVEATRFAERFGVLPLDAATVTRAEVTEAIRTCSDLHIALHARSDADDPSRSCLLLAGGEMAVPEIAAIRNERARLAYLSACETTLTTAALVDEGIHLTSAFQLTGFPQVVGTLWAVRGLVAAHAAERFYDELREAGGDAGRAVHETVRYLRDRYAGFPSAWAALHCVGA